MNKQTRPTSQRHTVQSSVAHRRQAMQARPIGRHRAIGADEVRGVQVRASRTSRRKRSWNMRLAAGAAVLVAGISIIGAAPGQSSSHGGLEPVSAAFQVVTVQAGDSLWSVAQRVDSTDDPRAIVDRLKALNDLDSSVLQPGQVLRVE